jgi:hypothetical protein
VAKGAESAKVDGPGLNAGITITGGPGSGEPGSGSALGTLADLSGFFAAAFGQAPDPMVAKQPKTTYLGPKYTVAYVMPGPNGVRSTLKQDVYPYAKPDPLTYMQPGQRFFGDQRTRGGWFIAPMQLKQTLVGIGLPASAPSEDDGFLPGLGTLAAFAAAALGLIAITVGLLRLRRRPRPVTT